MPNQPEKQENFFLNLALNILLPTFVLMKLSGEDKLGPELGLIVALSFPIGYGIYDYFRVRKINFFSAIGVVSVLLTGGISLMKLPPEYIAIKEAAIPGILGLATLISLYTPYSFIKVLLFNPNVMQVEKINHILDNNGTQKQFNGVLFNASLLVSCSFFLSSVLNYVLAKMIVVSEPGTEAFNEELGKMTVLSYPVIAVPSFVILGIAAYYMFRNIAKLTGLPMEQIFNVPEENQTSAKGEKQ